MILLIQVFMAIACLIEMFATTWPQWMAAKMMNVSRSRLWQQSLIVTGILSRYQPSHAYDVHQ